MRSKSKSKAALLILTSFAATQALADHHEGGDKGGASFDFYGQVTSGILQHSKAKIDQTKTNMDTVCTQAASLDQTMTCGPDKAQSYMFMGNGYAANKFGVHYRINDKVDGKLELGIGGDVRASDNSEDSVRPRKYYMTAELGGGLLTVGRQDRPFALVAKTADKLAFASVAGVAGSLYKSRGVGIVYNTGDLLGPASVSFGLVNPAKGVKDGMGSKETGLSSTPSVELSAAYDLGSFNVALGVVSETYTTTAEDSTYKTEGALMYSVATTLDVAMINAALTYTAGDPLYHRVTHNAKVKKGLKDKISGVNLNVKAKFTDKLSAGLFYGMETAALAKDNGHVNKTNEAADVSETGNTIGLNFTAGCEHMDWFFEYSNTTRMYDGETVTNESILGLGATVKFNS